MYFPDLFPYPAGFDLHGNKVHPKVVRVGWLDGKHPFLKGRVEPRLIEKLRILVKNPVCVPLGMHLCDVCVVPPDAVITYKYSLSYIDANGRNVNLDNIKMIDPECPWSKWTQSRQGTGEIRVRNNGMTFSAPVLIVHYIEQHDYLPPSEFLEALEKSD
jgi:hypothetical protein